MACRHMKQVKQVLFIGMSATGVRAPSFESLRNALQSTVDSTPELDDRERLAFDLYAASFSEESADARFLMLMMALETLVKQHPRNREAQDLIASFETTTRSSGLSQPDIDSISGALNTLRNESIGSAGRRLASMLRETGYRGEDAKTFFTECYTLRSRLVHGDNTRPSQLEIGVRAASLETFVADIIAKRLAV